MKKLIAMGMAGVMSAALLAGCGGAASSAAGTASTGTDSSSAAVTEAADSLNYSKLTVGTDGTDLNASLKILTNRTDLIEDGTFDKYISEFNAINPNLSEAERECRELESIYLACPPEMRKTLLDATRSLAIHLTEFANQNKNI